MACIDPNSKVFKKAMEAANLSSKSLMAAVQIWRNEDITGKRKDSDELPPESWLAAYKGERKIPTTDAKLAQLSKDNRSFIFQNEEDGIKEYQHLAKIFGAGGVYMYTDTTGVTVVGAYEHILPFFGEDGEIRPEYTSPNVLSGLDLSNVNVEATYANLAGTNRKTGKITLRKASFTPQEVLDHLQGKSGARYSDQKQAVMERLAKAGWPIDRIAALLSGEQEATSLILLHELSHREHKDSYDLRQYMSEEALGIETRATIDALEKLDSLKNPKPQILSGNVVSKGRIQMSETHIDGGSRTYISVKNSPIQAGVVVEKTGDSVWLGYDGLVEQGGQLIFPVKDFLKNGLLKQAVDLIPVGATVNSQLNEDLTSWGFEKLKDEEGTFWKKTAITTTDLHVEQHSSTSYASRTRANAQMADFTIALAEDFDTAGERLTRQVAGNKYISAPLTGVSILDIAKSVYNELLDKNFGFPPKSVTLNLAGNGIYTLSHPQEYYDDIITEVLKYLLEQGITIAEVRSGGQTGIDEAGIKAAQNLGLNYTILAPKGYKYRGKDGKDITGDKNGFVNRFNRPVTPVEYEVEEKPDPINEIREVYKYDEVTNREPFRATKALWHHLGETSTKEEKRQNLLKFLHNDEFGVGDRIIIDPSMPAADIVETVKILKGMRQYRVFSDGSPTQVAVSSFDAETLETFKKGGIEVGEKSVLFPSFTIGYSEYQLNLMAQEKKLTSSGLFRDTELRALAKASIFRLSDVITQLTSDRTAAQRLFPDTPEYRRFRYQDYTRMSRIDLFDETKGGPGLTTMLNLFVKEAFFNPTWNTEPATSSNVTLAKMQAIHNNFDAFIRLGYDSLIGLEQVSFTGGYRAADVNNLGATDTEIFSSDDEQSIQEVFGSSAEHWQVGFRQVSAIQSLAQSIRRKLGKLYQMDENGVILRDEFGFGKTIDAADAVTRILAWTQGAEDIDEMISILQRHMPAEPWLKQLVGTYHAGGNETEGEVQGILLDVEHNDQFRSQFFSNFKKYFQMYAITYKNSEGKTIVKGINTNGYTDNVLKAIETQAAQANMGALHIWNPATNNFSQDFRRLEQYILGEEGGVVPLAKDSLRDLLGQAENESSPVTDKMLERISEAYTILDMQTPSMEELRIVFPNAGSVQKFANQLYYTIQSIKETKTEDGLHLFSGSKNARSDYKKLAEILAPVMGTNVEAVSYEAGKMHYGYVNPSYLGILLGKLKGHVKDYDSFIDEQYKSYTGWFYTPQTGAPKGLVTANPWLTASDAHTGWMNWWLECLTTPTEQGAKARERLAHIVSLSDNKVGYTDKSDAQYAASLISMYLYDDNKVSAYFAVPTLSNKPSEEYIRFNRITEDYEGFITKQLVSKVFIQEVNRIRTVRDRAERLSAEEKIANYDEVKRGGHFVFLDFLNTYLDHKDTGKNTAKDKFSRALQKYVYGKEFNEDSFSAVLGNTTYSSELQYFIDALPAVVRREVNKQFLEFVRDLESQGFLRITGLDMSPRGEVTGSVTDIFQIKDKLGDGAVALQRLQEFFWNDMFASINILQLTVGDIAMYKHTEDIQKRLAQLHAPGIRGNVNARDISSPKQRVSDGFERTVYIKDAMVTSDIIENLEVVHEKLLQDPRYTENGHLTEAGKAYEKTLKKVQKAFKDNNINWADAQGYSSPTSYRKKMHIFGRWDERQEAAYNRLTNPSKYGPLEAEDFDVIWQPLKPFVYTQIGKANDTDLYMPKIKVGIQNKNSEYLLIIADALMRGMGVNKEGSILSAIYDVMEESAVRNPGRGIDTIQFESAVKTGLMGAVAIKPDMSYAEAKKALTDAIYREEDGGYNQTSVHEIPFEDYVLQQEVPAHLEGSQQQGSQDRILSIADMPDINPDGTPAMIKVAFGNEKPVEMTVAAAKERYYKAISDNIRESEEKLHKRLGLDNVNKKLQNIALSELLQEEILKDGRYGTDILWACSTNEMGEFNVPLSDPIQAGRIQQLLNSIIKNTINKQEIAGGPVVQVSSFGSMNREQLHIKFKNNLGDVLLDSAEFKKAQEEGKLKEYASFKDYLRANQAEVAYFEAFVSIYDQSIIRDFGIYRNGKFTGEIDVKKMERVNPKLLQMIGYRIPTESKYSMVPIKIVGFLPKMSGEGIMLPAELTTLSGSDFDVDKLYLMRYEFSRADYAEEDAIQEFAKRLAKSYKQHFEATYSSKEEFSSDVIALISQGYPGDFTPKQQASIIAAYQRFAEDKLKKAYTGKLDSRAARNNEILDIHWAMLTSRQAVDQLFTPGNFDEPKRVGYLIAAVDNSGGKASDVYGSLAKADVNTLKDASYKTKNILFAHTKIAFHRQNMVAAKLIGVFAQANVSHGFIGLHTDARGEQDAALNINPKKGFTLQDVKGNSRTISGIVPIDREYSWDGLTRQSAILASLLAASVDAVKDPILNLMNINMTTVNVAVSLIRLGYDIESIAWFLSTPIIKELVRRFDDANAKAFTSIDKVIAEMQQEESKDQKLVFDAKFAFGKDFFIEQHDAANNTPQYNYNLLELFKRVTDLSGTFRKITHMTRYNSITSAVGPYAANTIVQQLQDADFYNDKSILPSVRMAVNNPILAGFRTSSYRLERQILGARLIQAGPFMSGLLSKAKEKFGYMNDKLAQSISEFAMSYFVNMRTPIFDLSFENRDRMVHKFAEREYLTLSAPYKDNPFIKAIDRQYKETDRATHTGVYTLELRTKGLLPENLEDIRAGWTQLFREEQQRISESASPEKEENLALKLLEYNFFRAGLGFDPRTFTSLATAAVKFGIPNYIDNLLQTEGQVDYTAHYDNLLNQYMLNVGKPNLGIIEVKDIVDVKESKNSPSTYVGKYKKPVSDDTEGLAKIPGLFTDTEYAYVFLQRNGTIVIRPVSKLGGPSSQGFEIDPSTDIFNMRSVFGLQEVASSGREEVSPEDIESAASPDTIEDTYGMDEDSVQFDIMGGSMEAMSVRDKLLSFIKGLATRITDPTDETQKPLVARKRQYQELLRRMDLGETVTDEDINKVLENKNICP